MSLEESKVTLKTKRFNFTADRKQMRIKYESRRAAVTGNRLKIVKGLKINILKYMLHRKKIGFISSTH